MDYDYISKQAKSTIWVGAKAFHIPQTFLKEPPDTLCLFKPVKIGFLVDGFQLYFIKLTEEVKIFLFRIRKYPNAKPDDGYILKFHLMIVGFDEETKIDFMKHDKNKVSCTFGLSEATRAKINRVNPDLFYILAVVEMFEIKCLDETNLFRKAFNAFTDFMKKQFTDEDLRHIARLLKCPPDLKDIFTGRIPHSLAEEVKQILMLLRPELPQIVKYLDARSDEKKPDSDLDLGILLHYVARKDRGLQDPIPSEMAVDEFFKAHKLGLDFYKILTFDYLVKILNDATAMDILVAAIFFQDKALFEKAVHCFLNNFHKIMGSVKFQASVNKSATLARLIMHCTRISVSYRYVPIPGWPKPEPPTTKPEPPATKPAPPTTEL